MTWASAVGVVAGSLATVACVFVILWLVHRCLVLGDVSNEHLAAQLDAEHFRREAEEQRDAGLAKIAQLSATIDDQKTQLDQSRELLEKTHAKLVTVVDSATDADLADISRAVMGLSPKLPAASGAAASATSDRPATAETVSGTIQTK